jgi:ATP-binding cassette subfamily B protein
MAFLFALPGESMNLLQSYLKPHWPRMLLLALLLLGTIGLQIASPQILRQFIDAAGAGNSLQNLTRIALLFLAVALGTHVLTVAITFASRDLGWRTTNALRIDLALHCLQLDMSFHKARTPGELIERVDGDVSELASFFSQMMVRLLGNGLLVAGILVLLFREERHVGVVGAAYVLLTMLVLRWLQKPATKAWRESRQSHAELFGFLGERLVGVEDIRSNGGESYVMARLDQLMRVLLQRGRGAKLTGSLAFVAGYSTFMLALVATLGIGATLFSRGLVTIGTVYLLVSYVSKLDDPLKEIQKQVADLQRAAASAGRVAELLNTQPTLVEDAQSVLPAGALAVAFEGISFRYDDGAEENKADNVLEDISFELAPGKVMGVLGRTGSGKTTFTRLLARLYDPDAGAIRLAGIDVRDVSRRDLRARVGMVTQDVQLFEATIRDNLTFFSQRIPDQQIRDVLAQLGLWEWCASMPAGLDTELKAGGKSLSAGEAQLLALARVFLRDPGLVILDEASSRLDPATERLLEHAIDRLLEDRTAIVVAHRLATVQRADEIMVLESGRILEHGSRQALAGDPTSRFHSLLQIGLKEALA